VINNFMDNWVIYLVLLAILVTVYMLVRRVSNGHSGDKLTPMPVRQSRLEPIPLRLDDRNRPLTPISHFDAGSKIECLEVSFLNLVEAQVSSCVPRTARTIYSRLRASGVNRPFKVKTVEQALKILTTNHHSVVKKNIPGAKHQGYMVA
jgi:hypothetical protein